MGGRPCFLIIWWDLSESESNKISAGTGDGNADNWEGDNSESVLESLAISSLVVESCCFDSFVHNSGVKGEPLLFRYFFRRGDNLVDDSGVKGAPFLFSYFFGSFMNFSCTQSCLEDQESLTNV